MELTGWGRYPRVEGRLSTPRDEGALAALLDAGALIARGMGRAYGDSAIGRHAVSMRSFNRMIAFDDTTGQLTAESGVTLGEIIDAFLPRGWFPAVTPGTRFVSLGGAIAADVHGKNHHVDGSFGSFVDWIDLMGPGGTVTRCSRTENADLFYWTLGGMGLTGMILRASIRLRPVSSGWIRQTTLPARDLDEALDTFAQTMDSTYSMAWIDCVATGDKLGRSIIMEGEHAERDELPAQNRGRPFETPTRKAPGVPFDFPGFTLNPWSIRIFNELYYRNVLRRPPSTLTPYDSFFYPLDAVFGWNRIYGRRGFMQFQCVVPLDSHGEGLRLSFPMEGYTLALDFPVNTRALALMPELDRITADHGGRFYLAKDSRISAQTLRQTDPRWDAFAAWRRETGLARQFASAQSERLSV
jgi:decaprenylphospho-beta-D-ribofuranose 2-oxidase